MTRKQEKRCEPQVEKYYWNRVESVPSCHHARPVSTMAKKKSRPLDNEDDGGAEEEEPDFSDPEDFVDDITDEGGCLGIKDTEKIRGRVPGVGGHVLPAPIQWFLTDCLSTILSSD